MITDTELDELEEFARMVPDRAGGTIRQLVNEIRDLKRTLRYIRHHTSDMGIMLVADDKIPEKVR